MHMDKWKDMNWKNGSLILLIGNMMCWFVPILWKAVWIFQM